MAKQNKLTTKEIRSINEGRWVRVKWDDVGALDGVVVEKETFRTSRIIVFKAFFPATQVVDEFEHDQILKIGNQLSTKETGL